MDFSEHDSTERERLLKERDGAAKTLAETTERLQTLERQLEAVDAYAKIMGPAPKARRPRAKAQPRRRGRRNTGRAAAIRETIQNSPEGISRAGIIEALDCKGDKAAEQAVSNLLSNLKKSGAVAHEGRIYRWAQAE